MNKKITTFIAVIVAFLVGATGSWLIPEVISDNKRADYPLLAQRIFSEEPNDIRLGFSELRTKLIDYVNTQQETGNLINVYFEYLPTGTSVKINDSSKSIAASLIKVPLAMNIYKQIEQEKIDINQELQLKQEWLDDGFGELHKKGAGFSITIDELIELMLVESDNTATNALWSVYEEAGISYNDDIMNYVHIEFQVTEDQRAVLGARQYSSILKCLYFSCFNSFDDSQLILAQLTRTNFNDRLRRYLQKEPVTIAHKIGTYLEEYQSDCGIFYIEKNSYLLCVMVDGNDKEASVQIGQVSNIVYQHMQSVIEPN